MSGIIRRGHLILVAAFGKRVANPPMTAEERRKAEVVARARAAVEARKQGR